MFVHLRRLLPFLFACLCALSPVRGHDATESSLTVSADEDNLIVVASLSLPVASALLPADSASSLSAATLDQHRPALLAAADRVCVLADSTNTPLTPERVVVSIRDGHALELTLLYPAKARPTHVRTPFLAGLARGAYCVLADLRHQPATRILLTPDSAERDLAPLAP